MSLLNKASLIQIPSGYKDGTLYSAKPTNGDGDFTFSRGSNLAATRVNSDGLIEKGRENLLLQSNSFDTTWTTTNTSVTGGQSGYDGSNDAWLLTRTNTSGNLWQSVTLSGVHTFSVRLKKGTLDWVAILTNNTSNNGTYFNLNTGAKGTDGSNVIQSSITSLGSGWYQCSVTLNVSTTAVYVYPAVDDLDVSGSSGNILIQDAQLEVGLTSTDVITTTTTTAQAGILEDMPRLDYSGGATCPSLLLEPQRSNIVTDSEYFGAWNNVATLTPNASISPEGVQNAYSLASNTGLGNGVQKIFNFSAGVAEYTSTIYYKSAGATTGKFRMFDGSTGGSTNITLEPTSEWKRAEITRTSGASTTQWRIDIFDNDGDLLIWGCQIEQGSYPTSYIPTYGASVTRSVDFSGLNEYIDTPIEIGANDDFTMFYEGSFDDVSSTYNMILGGGNQSTGNDYKNYWWVRSAAEIRISGNAETLMSKATGLSLTDNTNIKILVKRSGSSISFFKDGVELSSSNDNPNIAFTLRSIGWSYSKTYAVSGNLKQTIIFLTALSDDECIQLTTI